VKLPDTTLSRSLVIRMKRKRASETVQDFEHLDDEGLARLRSQALRWAADWSWRTPETIPGFNNRVRMNWRPLLSIAEAGGAEWKLKAWEAARSIEGARVTDETSLGTRLLADLRDMFGEGVECLLSRTIIEILTADPEKPWAEYRRGKPITQKQLASVLRQYTIVSGEVHPADLAHGKGYKRQQFEEAWERYLTPLDTPSSGKTDFEARKRASPSAAGTSAGFSSAREQTSARFENDDLSYSHNGLRACALEKAKTENEGSIPGPERRCAHCGLPQSPGSPLLLCSVNGTETWGHKHCIEVAWRDWPDMMS